MPPTLTDPALERAWSAIRERLERQGIEATGRVVLSGLARAERHALGALLGRDVVRE